MVNLLKEQDKNNLEAQENELETIEAIYGDDFHRIKSGSTAWNVCYALFIPITNHIVMSTNTYSRDRHLHLL